MDMIENIYWIGFMTLMATLGFGFTLGFIWCVAKIIKSVFFGVC